MPRQSTPFFDYIEERPIGRMPLPRRRHVASVKDPIGHPDAIPEFSSSRSTNYGVYELEGRGHLGDSEGAWSQSAMRMMRHVGDPGKKAWPYTVPHERRLVDPKSLSPRVRLHHYFRLFDASDCRALNQFLNTCVSIEVTEEWHDPRDGIIASIPPGSPVIGSHCIGGLCHDAGLGLFAFPNSWGTSWGQNGFGGIAADVLDRYMIEGWAMVGQGTAPPLRTKSGIVALLWKSSVAGREVHGREFLDVSQGERIGWTFLVRRGHQLDIEEFFVWPTYRGQGLGGQLAELVKELAKDSGCSLRALIGWPDAEISNRVIVQKMLRRLDLQLHASSERTVAFWGLPTSPSTPLVEPCFPTRPTSFRDKLHPENATRKYTVWYGTDRRPIVENGTLTGYSNSRGDEISFGTCDVAIPRTHRFGSVGPNFWKRWLRLTDEQPLELLADDRLEEEEFWSSVASALGSCEDEHHALVYIHGFCNTFEQAAIRAAQIGFDLKVPGVTAFFSWPSAGQVASYCADEATIEASEAALTQFLEDFVARSGADKVHLIAHSMGNRGFLRSIQRMAARVSESSTVKFDQVILAAPDIDAMVFRDLALHLPAVSNRVTMYVSPSDRAVQLSNWLHNFPRAGLTPPITIVPGVETVEVPALDLTDPAWHAYYAESGAVLGDMFTLIRTNLAPSDRQRLIETRTTDGERFWALSL